MMNDRAHLSRQLALGAGLLFIGAPVALGQTATSTTQQYVSPIDEGVSDLSPLSASLIQNPADLRAVRQFDFVYPVPGRPDMLMRQSGALSAVFPHSDYKMIEVDDEEVVAVLIPAGTIFYIGPIPPDQSASFYSPVRPPRAAGIQSSASLLVSQPVTQPAGAQPLSIPQARLALAGKQPVAHGDEVQRPRTSMRIVTISDERYRRYRLGVIARKLAAENQ